MPRPKKPGQDSKEVKTRSRNGCWPCKDRKVKCGEEKPNCLNCQRQGQTCDYSIRLNWDGRTKKKDDGKPGSQPLWFDSNPVAPKQASSANMATTPDIYVFHVHDPVSHLAPSPSSASSPGIHLVDREPPLAPVSMLANSPAAASPLYDQPLPNIVGVIPPVWNDATAYGSIQGMASMPRIRHFQQPSSYPSPAESSFGSPNVGSSIFNTNGRPSPMPPPLPTSNPVGYADSVRSPDNSAKRIKLSPQQESFSHDLNRHRASSYGPGDLDEVQRPPFQPLTPTLFSAHINNPPTPAESLTTADDLPYKWMSKSTPSTSNEHTEFRRVSVNSLLSGSPEPEESRPKLEQYSHNGADTSNSNHYDATESFFHQSTGSTTQTETYGLDCGHPDLDLPRNNDTSAISGMSPSEHSDLESWLNFDAGIPEFGFGLQKREIVFAKGGYYASPVPIKIPKSLEPLPATLLENPMNLLYFHHFLNHTARILVPHDCSQNPFKTILPKMAVEDKNLLNLLLAYSASHRARLLVHPEPANRIALWVQDVFPSLRYALNNLSDNRISNSNLATAIMLASLEIISPSTFGVSVPWQKHLSVARSIIKSRGGGPQSVSRKDPVPYFLTRWLAYLDVLGSLSGRRNEEPLFGGNYWTSSSSNDGPTTEPTPEETEDDDYTIDCLLGFTTRCVSILAQIATLARQCDWQRVNTDTSKVNPDWRPSPNVLAEADRLRQDLEIARLHSHKQCPHQESEDSNVENSHGRQNDPDKHIDARESSATNSAFHWAGLIHLLRRIHNLPRNALEVQNAVKEIVGAVHQVRKGGSAEACLLFPMFTAGVEAENEGMREAILERVKDVEEVGMCQVGRARALMEEVWRTGKEWEGLVTGEFFG